MVGSKHSQQTLLKFCSESYAKKKIEIKIYYLKQKKQILLKTMIQT